METNPQQWAASLSSGHCFIHETTIQLSHSLNVSFDITQGQFPNSPLTHQILVGMQISPGVEFTFPLEFGERATNMETNPQQQAAPPTSTFFKPDYYSSLRETKHLLRLGPCKYFNMHISYRDVVNRNFGNLHYYYYYYCGLHYFDTLLYIKKWLIMCQPTLFASTYYLLSMMTLFPNHINYSSCHQCGFNPSLFKGSNEALILRVRNFLTMCCQERKK